MEWEKHYHSPFERKGSSSGKKNVRLSPITATQITFIKVVHQSNTRTVHKYLSMVFDKNTMNEKLKAATSTTNIMHTSRNMHCTEITSHNISLKECTNLVKHIATIIRFKNLHINMLKVIYTITKLEYNQSLILLH